MKRMVQRGFTLIELVVVIVILGILAAVAIPQFTDLSVAARQAVVDGTCGAIQSQAVLLYASDKRSHTGTEIFNAITPGTSGVTITNTGCSFSVAVGTQPPVACSAALPPALCP